MFCGPSTVDVSLGFSSGNIDSLGSTKHTVSLGHVAVLESGVLIGHKLNGFSLIRFSAKGISDHITNKMDCSNTPTG